VGGAVLLDTTHVAVAGQAIRLSSGGVVREAVATGADGSFSLGVFPLGPFSLEAIDAEGVAIARATGSAATPGVNVAQNLVVPTRGNVSVLVQRGAERLGGLAVTFTSTHAGALDEDRLRTRNTAADGTVTTALPTGPVTARVSDPRNGAQYEVGDTLTEGGALALTINLPESLTHLFGTVTSADGSTPLPGAVVALAGAFTATTTTDATGRYEFVSLPPGSYTLTGSIGGASAAETVSLNGGERPVDVHVSVPVLKGLVTEADGITPAEARIELCGGNPHTCVSQSTHAGGLYAFYGGFPAWIVGTPLGATVTAADASGLTQFDSLVFGGGVVTRNFRLPTAWAVFGVVRDAEGLPVAAEVRLTSSGPERSLTTGSDGSFRFPHVPAFVNAIVRAADQYGLPGEASGVVLGSDLKLDVTLAPGATFAGQLLSAAGTPLQAEIQVESLPYLAIDGYSRWTRSIPTDVDGRFSTIVPACGFRAVYDPGSCSIETPARHLLAVADGTLVPGANPEQVLRIGDGMRYPAVLGGPLGTYGPSPLHPSRDTLCADGDVTLTASVAGEASPAVAGHLGANGRSVTSLLSQAGGLDVRQEQFVPASGAFLRTITWLQNPGTVDVAADVQVTADFGDGLGWVSIERSAAFTLARLDEPVGPEAGAVYGAGAVQVSFQRGSRGDGVTRAGVVSSFSLVVPAGQRRGVMAFAVGRSADHGVPAQVRALADLSDPEALAGLSETDRQQIVNFTVPAVANAATGVEGTVSRDGFASRGATVAAIDPRDGTVVAYGSTDASGHFTLRGLLAGDVRLVAVDPASHRPGTADAIVAEGSLTTADVATIAAADMGTVVGSVLNGAAATVAGAHVTVRSDAFAPLWNSETISGPAGEYTLAAPPGGLRLRVNDDPSTETGLNLDPGGTITLDLTVP
jgi:hypothetical protein